MTKSALPEDNRSANCPVFTPPRQHLAKRGHARRLVTPPEPMPHCRSSVNSLLGIGFSFRPLEPARRSTQLSSRLDEGIGELHAAEVPFRLLPTPVQSADRDGDANDENMLIAQPVTSKLPCYESSNDYLPQTPRRHYAAMRDPPTIKQTCTAQYRHAGPTIPEKILLPFF